MERFGHIDRDGAVGVGDVINTCDKAPQNVRKGLLLQVSTKRDLESGIKSGIVGTIRNHKTINKRHALIHAKTTLVVANNNSIFIINFVIS